MNCNLKLSTLGLARSYFAILHKEGFKLTVAEQKTLVQLALTQLESHIKMHLVYPERIDQFKFMSYLIYKVMEGANSGRFFVEPRNPVTLISKVSVMRLKELLYIDTSTATKLDQEHCTYICNMLSQEVAGQPEIGLGANGLATTFSMVAKYGHRVPDMQKI